MNDGPAWFCLRSQPKHEHIAAAHLRRMGLPEVFSPRLRFRKATRQGVKWVTEALFPNYLFARFEPAALQARVRHAPGVAGLVQFGGMPARVPDAAMADLRSRLRGEETVEVAAVPEPGDLVRLAAPPFRGLEAVVRQVLPGRERVRVLLDFLGGAREVEVGLETVVSGRPPSLILA